MAGAIGRVFSSVIDYLELKKYTTRWSDRWTIIRVWVALWLCAVSMLIRPVEHAAGIAAFLPVILGFVKFPSDPTVVFLFQSFLGGLATLAAWGWSALAMKCSLEARDQNRDLATLAQLNATAYQKNPDPYPGQIEGQLIEDVFRGAFLQTGPSIIYGAFFFVGTYFILLIRAMNVRLFFIMVFAIIPLSIFATIGPLIPIWYARELGAVYLVPYAYYLACSTFAAVFIFPQSVSRLCMERIRVAAGLMVDAVALSPAKLRDSDEGDVEAAITQWDAKRYGIIQIQELITLVSRYLSKEISFGRASGKDVERLVEMFRELAASLSGQSIFVHHVRFHKEDYKINKEVTLDSRTAGAGGTRTSITSMPYAPVSDLEDLLAELGSTTIKQQAAINKGILALSNFLDRETHWDHGFWGLAIKQPPSETAEMIVALEELRATCAELSVDEKHGYDPSSPSIKNETISGGSPGDLSAELSPMPTVGANLPLERRPSYLREIWRTFLHVFTKDLEGLLELAIKIEQKPVRMWWPGKQNQSDYPDHRPVPQSLAQQFSRAMGGQADLPAEENNPDWIDGLQSLLGNELDPESHEKTNVSRKVYDAWNWFTASHESTFSLKVAVLAVALACPAWITANGTSEFYYRYKGIWALITAITAKGMFSGETSWGFVQRLLGSVIGATVAMAAWYISAGGGDGNAYGLAATFGVLLALIIPWRIWNPNFLLIITVTTTGTLVLGYSWTERPDSTARMVWGPGQGYEVYWKRILVVLIGITAAWIIDLFPKPRSGRDNIRKTYSITTLRLGNLTAELTSALRGSPKDPAALSTFVRAALELRAIHAKLRVSNARILLAKLEPTLRGPWKPEPYIALQKLQFDAVDLLGLFAYTCERMDSETRTRLFATPAFQTLQVVSLLNHFNTISSSLATERPLPALLPSPNTRHRFADVDSELAEILNNLSDRTDFNDQLLIIAEGTFIQLGKIADKLAAEVRILFGTTMVY